MGEFQVPVKMLTDRIFHSYSVEFELVCVWSSRSLKCELAVSPPVFLKPYTIPDPDSTRDDLQYYEHDANPHDDWIIRTKKEWSGLPRIATHPLDLAVLRLANLERNIERRYLKEPLWNPAEVMRLAPLTPTPGEEHPMDVIR